MLGQLPRVRPWFPNFVPTRGPDRSGSLEAESEMRPLCSDPLGGFSGRGGGMQGGAGDAEQGGGLSWRPASACSWQGVGVVVGVVIEGPLEQEIPRVSPLPLSVCLESWLPLHGGHLSPGSPGPPLPRAILWSRGSCELTRSLLRAAGRWAAHRHACLSTFCTHAPAPRGKWWISPSSHVHRWCLGLCMEGPRKEPATQDSFPGGRPRDSSHEKGLYCFP